MTSMDLPRGKHATRWDALYSEVERKSSKMFDVFTEVPGKSLEHLSMVTKMYYG